MISKPNEILKLKREKRTKIMSEYKYEFKPR